MKANYVMSTVFKDIGLYIIYGSHCLHVREDGLRHVLHFSPMKQWHFLANLLCWHVGNLEEVLPSTSNHVGFPMAMNLI